MVLVGLATLLAGLPACAANPSSGQPGREALLSDTPPPTDRRCRVASDPAALPAAAAMVDSAALLATAAALWQASEQPPGYVLFSMRYDTAGLNVRRDVIEHRVSAGLADTMQALVYAARREVESADAEWAVRLRLDLGPQPTLRVGRSEVCQPWPRDRAHLMFGANIGRTWGDVRDPSYTTLAEESVLLWVLTDADGRVTDVRLQRGARRPGLEQRLFTYVRTLQFLPATEDGFPVPGETSVRLRI